MKTEIKELFKRVKPFFRKIKTAAGEIPSVKYFAAGAVCLCMLFRFGSYVTGSNPAYIRMGDVNGDGIVSTSDVFGLARLSFGENENSENFTAADMNADGRLSAEDVFSLIRMIGGSENEVVYAEELKLNTESVSLCVGAEAEALLTAEILPENVTVKDIVWSCSDENVVTVEDGLLTAVGEGEAYVAAVSGDGMASAKCLVTVSIGVSGVEFSLPEIYIREDSAPILLSAAVYPENATNKSLIWDSSDWNVVGVDSMGAITPFAVGTAVVYAMSRDGCASAECVVHVLEEETAAEAENAPDISEQKQQKSGSFTNYVSVPRTLDSMLDIQCGFYNISASGLTTLAQPSEVARYVNPENYCEGTAKYQFLDLSVPNNMTADELNTYLKNKGILSGMGQTFIDAANEYGVSEAYLVAHSCLETGNGKSRLAMGVEFNGCTVYNMFGIGAYDGNALMGGASYAYSQGWTTPEAAIKGGAEWIAQNYIYRSKSRQNTLYKMRWNPFSPGSHQYATDVGWAVKQSYIMAAIIGNSNCLLIFEIPVYSGTYTGYVPDVSPVPNPDTAYAAPPEEIEEKIEEEIVEEAAEAAAEAADGTQTEVSEEQASEKTAGETEEAAEITDGTAEVSETEAALPEAAPSEEFAEASEDNTETGQAEATEQEQTKI